MSTRDRAAPPEEPLPLTASHRAPKDTTPCRRAPPGPSWDPSLDPEAPRRSEDHLVASDISAIRRPPRHHRACVRAPGAHQHRSISARRVSEETRCAAKARLQAPRERGRSDAAPPVSSEEPPGSAGHSVRAPCAAARPRETGLPTPKGRASAPATEPPREDAVPNVRAALRLRRALQQGAERSERPRLSPLRDTGPLTRTRKLEIATGAPR